MYIGEISQKLVDRKFHRYYSKSNSTYRERWAGRCRSSSWENRTLRTCCKYPNSGWILQSRSPRWECWLGSGWRTSPPARALDGSAPPPATSLKKHPKLGAILIHIRSSEFVAYIEVRTGSGRNIPNISDE